MTRTLDYIMTIVTDVICLTASFIVFYWLRVESGLMSFAIEPEMILPLTAMLLFWIVWFFLSGLYREWYYMSRLEEVVSLARAITLGILIVFFVVLYDDLAANEQTARRSIILWYWVITLGTVTWGRLTLRWFQKMLLRRGVGVLPAIIVGWSKKAFELADVIRRSPALGYRAVGFVTLSGKRAEKSASRSGLPLLGTLSELPMLVRQYGVREVFVGLDSSDHERLMEVLQVCETVEVAVKIMPNMYDIVSGQARISSIHGVPLMDVRPGLLSPWETVLKRMLDLVVSGAILVIGLPLWLLVAVLIRIDSTGAVLYRQERVGRNGVPFSILKFRSMYTDSERKSGPVWA